MPIRTIKVAPLARVEGEGALLIRMRGEHVEEVQLNIFEPPRFFEALLRGRKAGEVPDIVARICGICPVAYQMTAVQALEQAAGVTVSGQLRALRRLLYCGEWIESHSLHIFLLHAPDFLGYEDAISMAKDHPGIVERGLRIKQAGNRIMSLLGGREIHPINVRLGGFYRVPPRRELDGLRELLLRGRDEALESLRWAAGLAIPEFHRDYEFVALRHRLEYPIDEGRIVSSHGLDIAPDEFDAHFVETQAPHSTALHCLLRERGAYLVGPMARYNLNFDRLSPLAQQAARESGLPSRCTNPFQSILVRCVEVLYAFDEALRIIGDYHTPYLSSVEVAPRAATGYACTEAPRGLLFHRYTTDAEGMITGAKLVPPTSQNQKTIEEDLRSLVKERFRLNKKQLTRDCEQSIRNYDPCISCATHFLRLEIEQHPDDAHA